MTKKQMAMFWPVFAEACREHGFTTPQAKEDYRHQLLWDADKARHMSEVSSTGGFERLMQMVSLDAGDYLAASNYAIGDERRIGAMIDDCTRQIFEIAGVDKSSLDRISYVGAVLEQAGFSRVRINSASWWMDYDAEKPIKVFQILDTYRRRLLKRQGVSKGLGYRYGKEYAS